VGNRAVTDLLRTPKPAVQRDIVDDRDASSVLLDRFNRPEERAQVLGASIYEKLWRSDALGGRSFDDIYDAVLPLLSTMASDIETPSQVIGLSDFVESKFAALLGETPAATRHDAFMEHPQLAPHEAMTNPKVQGLFGHYNFFDDNMIWRFTTRPTTEVVYIAPNTTQEAVAKVVAAHSGGADKSNPNVKTLSFGRNLGALMGVAASAGGDKKVLNIADKAEYVYGIDIRSLRRYGITAHPATARLISLYETEYVLVSTPGDKARTLDELATVKYANPFKSGAIRELLSQEERQGRGVRAAQASMPPVAAEEVSGVQSMDLAKARRILAYAMEAKKAASALAASVKDKEGIADPELIDKTMAVYNKDLPRRR
jgi:hypothetical protein